jgi:ADP-heptose:LPS heptosyltransferase
VRRILFIRYGNMGDVLLDTPLIRESKKVFKSSRIHYLTRFKQREILEVNPHVEGVIIRENYTLGKLIGKIRSENYDVVFDLQHNVESMLITWLSGALTRVAIEKRRGNFPYNYRIKPDFSIPYTVFHRLHLLIPFGYEKFSIELEFPVPQSVLEDMGRRVEKIKDGFNIAVLAVTGNRLKDWELENYAWIADKMVDDFNARIFFLWEEETYERVKKILNFAKRRHYLAPETKTLLKLAAFLHEVDLYFGADSGPKHIAVSQKTPTFTIFTHAEPRSWTPPGDPLHDFIYKGLSCQPCWAKKECPIGSYKCLKELSPEEVYSKLRTHMEKIRVHSLGK